MKGTIIGTFATLVLILLLPLFMLISEQKKTSHSEVIQATPTPVTMTFADGEGIIAGYVYHDINRDGKRETGEKPIPSVKVQMKILKEGEPDQHTTFDATTDTYGYFNFRFPAKSQETYMVKVVLPQGYKTQDANPLIISDLKTNTEKIVEFGLIPLSNVTPSPTRKPTATEAPTATP